MHSKRNDQQDEKDNLHNGKKYLLTVYQRVSIYNI